MFVTLYNPSKKNPKVRTILVQAEQSKQAFNIAFVDSIFPSLYVKVKQMLEQSNTSRPNLRRLAKKSYQEDYEDESIKETKKIFVP